MKRCSTPFVIRSMEIKTTWYHYTANRMTKILKTDNTNYCWDCETIGSHWYGNVKWCRHFGRLTVSYKAKHSLTIIIKPSNHAIKYLLNWVEIYIYTEACIWVFTVIIFIIARNWQKPMMSFTRWNGWTVVHQFVEHYLVIRNEL